MLLSYCYCEFLKNPELNGPVVNKRYLVRSSSFETGRPSKTAAFKSFDRQRAWFETQAFQNAG